jgi:hypothetical protein
MELGDTITATRISSIAIDPGIEAAGAAPLADGELRSPDDPGELIDGVVFPHLLPLDQHTEHRLDFL